MRMSVETMGEYHRHRTDLGKPRACFEAQRIVQLNRSVRCRIQNNIIEERKNRLLAHCEEPYIPGQDMLWGLAQKSYISLSFADPIKLEDAFYSFSL